MKVYVLQALQTNEGITLAFDETQILNAKSTWDDNHAPQTSFISVFDIPFDVWILSDQRYAHEAGEIVNVYANRLAAVEGAKQLCDPTVARITTHRVISG